MANLIKKNWSILLLVFVGLIIFIPTLKFDFTEKDWVHFLTVSTNIPGKLPIFQIPLTYYYNQYGWFWISVVIAKMFIGLNPFLYFLLSLVLRIIAGISIYKLVLAVTKSKFSSTLAGLFFLLSLSGIETTTWVTQLIVYIILILLAISFTVWFQFLEKPSKSTFLKSFMFYLLTIWVSHIRAYAYPLVMIIANVYTLFSEKDKSKIYWQKTHLFFTSISFLYIYFITDMMKTTYELSGKMVSFKILLKSLITGFPPVIHSLILFLGNIITPPQLFSFSSGSISSYYNNQKIIFIIIAITFVNLIVLLKILKKRQFPLAIIFVPVFFYPFSVYFSTKYMVGWQTSWYPVNILGGCILFYLLFAALSNIKTSFWPSVLILLGILISTSHIFIPWISFLMPESNEQSAFDFLSRYYSIPVFGLSLSWGGLSSILLNRGNNPNTSLKFLYLPIRYVFFITLIAVPICNGYFLTKYLYSNNRQSSHNFRTYIARQINDRFYHINKQEELTLIIVNELDPVKRSELIHGVPKILFINYGFRNLQNNPSVTILNSKSELTNVNSNNIYIFIFTNNELKEIK